MKFPTTKQVKAFTFWLSLTGLYGIAILQGSGKPISEGLIITLLYLITNSIAMNALEKVP